MLSHETRLYHHFQSIINRRMGIRFINQTRHTSQMIRAKIPI